MTKKQNTKEEKTGRFNLRQFTLMELLVVISIIGLLTALTLPVFSHVKSKAKMTKCIGNLHQIGVRLHSYVDDYDGYMPVCKRIGDTPSDPMALQNVMPMPSCEIYRCPADTKKEFSGMTFFEKHGSSYEWNAWFNGSKLSGNTALTSLLGELPTIWDSAKFHGKLGHNFLYSEGKVTTE
jgi:prepilin-type N-terminal cleavage/methylation domain-containing protein